MVDDPVVFEQTDGCGNVCVSFRASDLARPPAPMFLTDRMPRAEPSFESLVAQARAELLALEREVGLDIPPRNPGKVEGGPILVGSPAGIAILAGIFLLVVALVVLVAVLS